MLAPVAADNLACNLVNGFLGDGLDVGDIDPAVHGRAAAVVHEVYRVRHTIGDTRYLRLARLAGGTARSRAARVMSSSRKIYNIPDLERTHFRG